MKKTTLFIATITALSFASCKKDHTCTCTTTHSNGGSATTDVTTYTDARKGDAKKACIDETNTYTYTVLGTTYTDIATKTCDLK